MCCSYHDFKRGVDTIETKPDRPLPRGDISPHMVKRALKWMYAAHLTLICLVNSATLRLWVLGSTMLTYLYSQHLKPRTGIKNVVCALIIAMAVGLGGMAVGGFPHGLLAVWPSMLIIGAGILHRELNMDIQDMAGDAITGVPTVPVRVGRTGLSFGLPTHFSIRRAAPCIARIEGPFLRALRCLGHLRHPRARRNAGSWCDGTQSQRGFYGHGTPRHDVGALSEVPAG